jgi:carboxyl-terminal processing protease
MKNILFITLSFVLTVSLFSKEVQEVEEEPTRLESYTKLQKVLAAVEMLYVEDMNLSKIVDKSISGLLHELDAHSSMLNKESYKDMQVETKGEFGGLGIVIGQRAIVGAGSMVINNVEPGTVVAGNPARFIRRIDG